MGDTLGVEIEQFGQPLLEHVDVIVDQIGPVIAALLDDADQCQVLFHLFQQQNGPVRQFDDALSLVLGVIHMFLTPVDIRDVQKHVDHFTTHCERVYLHGLTVSGDVQFAYNFKEESLFHFAIGD